MQRRLIAAIVAIVLAGIGAIMLFNFVSTADTRAMQGLETVKVLVVTTQVPAGTLGSQLGSYVQERALPKVAVVDGALNSTDTIKELAAVTTLEVGEQILPSRFAKQGTSASGGVVVPTNMQTLSMQLDPQRVVGGTLTAGSKVAIYVTVDGTTTQQILNGVLVTNVKDGVITIALEPKNAERVILALEGQRVWVVLDAAVPASTSPISVKQILG
jgi:pilus assembly protein CpaB